jgi:ubiquinone/menaquinone biosynthesis C-methylase UbiE
MRIEELMKRQWNSRAKKNANKYVAWKDGKTEEAFFSSGLKHANRILQTFPEQKIKSLNVLELGAGVGRIAAHIAPLVNTLTLADISSEMIKINRAKFRDPTNVTLFQCNGLDLSGLSNCSFDLVYSIWVFQHVPQKIFENYLREIKRTLKPKSTLVFQIFEKLKVADMFPKFWLRNLRHANFGFWRTPPDQDTWIARAYSRQELSAILENAGFNVLSYDNPTDAEEDLWITAQTR